MARKREIKFNRVLDAPAREVFRAFTSATALREWLCDGAIIEARKGGSLYLSWHSGYYTRGEYTLLAPDRKVAFTWHGRDEPLPTLVQAAFRPQAGKTRLELTHSGIGYGKAWTKAVEEFRNGWEVLLENLQSVLETGIDLRFARLPMLGVGLAEALTPKIAERIGVPYRKGIYIARIAQGMAAANAGLQENDVMWTLAGKRLTDVQALSAALRQYRAGDRLKVVFYRGNVQNTSVLELSPRPLPEIPPTPQAMADAVRDIYATDQADLRRCLDGVLDSEASAQPAPEEWSAKEALAHLIASERDLALWIASLIEEDEIDHVGHGNFRVRIDAIVAVYATVPALIDELISNQAEVVNTVSKLPDWFVSRRGSYWRLGYNLLSGSRHTRDHVEQIGRALAVARRQ